jgi:hypothetical protein
MTGLLKKSPQIILISEFGPGNLKRFGSDPAAFLKNLADLGFKIREISEAKASLLEVDLSELSRRFPPGDEGYTNLFCEKE